VLNPLIYYLSIEQIPAHLQVLLDTEGPEDVLRLGHEAESAATQSITAHRRDVVAV
jgi:hypothetical protein